MCDEERALLAGVCVEPGCDVRRLVYADWFDEHAQPARAEFIRVQVALERVSKTRPPGAPVWDGAGAIVGIAIHPTPNPEWHRLVRRQNELAEVGRFTKGYLDLDQLAWCHRSVWGRGFPVSVECSVEDFLKHATELLWNPKEGRPCPETAQPVRTVFITGNPRVASVYGVHGAVAGRDGKLLPSAEAVVG